MMSFIILVLLISALRLTSTEENKENLDSYIIACHTTDIECFKRQYVALRNHVLLGNHVFGIQDYTAYVFQYSDTGTCVQITGIKESELTCISVDSAEQLLTMFITMPVHIQQIWNVTQNCVKPDREFSLIGPYFGHLKKFSGNATIEVKYPFQWFHGESTDTYMALEDSNLDVVLDIPDLSHYDRDSELELKLYEWSEWAFKMVQHVDVAEHVIVPYIDQYKKLFSKVPIRRFILLYPDEQYAELKFKLSCK